MIDTNLKDLFDHHFGAHVTISDDAYQFLCDCFYEKTYSSRELIVEGGGMGRYFYFVTSGVQTIYLLNAKGEKTILGFSFSGTVSGEFDSFISGNPSHFFLEALTPSIMYGINKVDFDELFKKFPEFYQWRAHFMEQVLLGRLSREVEMLTKSAKDRFDAFTKRCPPELLQIPQKYLASYLNMTPETFSRLRALKQ